MRSDKKRKGVTYYHQPAINETKGNIPLEGNTRLYTVTKILWPYEIESYLATLLIGETIHLCCGKSMLGDLRVDLNEMNADLRCDAANMKGYIEDKSYDTSLCDPPYNGKMQWNHDLLSEMARITRKRIIFQHWFLPADQYGRYRKDHHFILSKTMLWQPQTYFGRVQVISVFDNRRRAGKESND